MNFSHEQITGSLRLTTGIFNDQQEIEQTIDIIKKVVEELRSVSPFKEKYSFISEN
jgi:cysteine desulfurase